MFLGTSKAALAQDRGILYITAWCKEGEVCDSVYANFWVALEYKLLNVTKKCGMCEHCDFFQIIMIPFKLFVQHMVHEGDKAWAFVGIFRRYYLGLL